MDEDRRFEITKARLSNLLRRHEDLKERLSRDSDKMVFERLIREFEAARVAQTEAIYLEDEQWNDGLLATIREKVHMEVDRKAMPTQANTQTDPHFQSKPMYVLKNKVIYCLGGTRIGVQYDTFFAGEICDVYHVVIESKSFLEKMTVVDHTFPFFFPIRDLERDFLSSNATKFIDYIGDAVQSYVDRREQVRLIKELYGNQIKEMFHSLAYNTVEFVVEDIDCKVTFSLRYGDLLTTMPSRTRVLAWPFHPLKKILVGGLKENAGAVAMPTPSRLQFAEDALAAKSLPEAYAEIVLSLPQALKQLRSFSCGD